MVRNAILYAAIWFKERYFCTKCTDMIGRKINPKCDSLINNEIVQLTTAQFPIPFYF
jgi:hypothetical protein